MHATTAGFKRFVERYKFVLAIVALMVGPSAIVLGMSISYYRGTIGELRIEHADAVKRYRAEVDFERTVNRGILQGMQEHLDMLTERLGIAATKVEDAAATANKAAQDAAKAAAAIPDVIDVPEDGNEAHSDNGGPLQQ